MGFQQIEHPSFAFSHENGEDIVISLAEAANASHGSYDTPEDRQARLDAARRLEITMVPDAPVLHQVSGLEVRGGLLLEPPKVIIIPHGYGYETGITYSTQQASGTYRGAMRLRDLAYGVRYGRPERIAIIAAGAEDISRTVRQRFLDQRMQESSPGGIAWHDISPLTELYVYGALPDTGIGLNDILQPHEIVQLRHHLDTGLLDPINAPIRPALYAAYAVASAALEMV